MEANWSGHFKNDIRLTLDAVLLIDPSNFKYREADILLFGGLFEIDPLRSQNLLGYFLKETSELQQLFNTVSHAQFGVRKVLGYPILSPFIDESRTVEGMVVNIEKAKKKSVMEIRKNAFLLSQVMRKTKRLYRLPSFIVVFIIAMTIDTRVQHADEIGKMAFNAEQEALGLRLSK